MGLLEDVWSLCQLLLVVKMTITIVVAALVETVAGVMLVMRMMKSMRDGSPGVLCMKRTASIAACTL